MTVGIVYLFKTIDIKHQKGKRHLISFCPGVFFTQTFIQETMIIDTRQAVRNCKLIYPGIKPRILYYDVRLFYNSLEKIYFFAVNSFGGTACQYNQSAQLIDESYLHVKIYDFLFTFNPRLFYPVFPKNRHFV